MIYLHYFKNLLIKNPIKVVMIGLLILLWNLGNNLKPQTNEDHFIHSMKYESKWLYITRDNKGSYSVVTFDKEPKVVGDKIVYQSTNDAIVPICLGFIILVIVLIVSSVIPEEDANWGFSDIWKDTKINYNMGLISCEIEDEIYYYIFKDRLLTTSKYQLSSYDLSNRLDKFPYSTLPKFPGTKEERRDKKLKELFNES